MFLCRNISHCRVVDEESRSVEFGKQVIVLIYGSYLHQSVRAGCGFELKPLRKWFVVLIKSIRLNT